MALIKSISGIRGTIGGNVGEGLTPLDVVKFASAYGTWLKRSTNKDKVKVVVGRDARISGPMVNQLVLGALQGLGADVIDLGLSTTPTVEVAVPGEGADGGIILTASHNPKQWNALKLLNSKGEFISAADGAALLEMIEAEEFDFVEVDDLGALSTSDEWLQKHVDAVVALEGVDVEAIKAANFKVAVDAVNSTGGIFIPAMLRALGVTDIVELYCEPTGQFPHNPEPLPAHLTAISEKVQETGAHLGIVVDPDVDRLCFVNEDGSMFGEEYTLVAVADYLLSLNPGRNSVSNMSSTRALRDVTEKHGGTYTASSVGEVNVVDKMKATDALIGGEGNGGIIYPGLHYGRDALVGTAFFLSHLAKTGMKMTELKASYPEYHMSKNKIQLTPQINVDQVLTEMNARYASNPDVVVNIEDGVKIDFADEWVHLRKSNTEPIIRVYSESGSPEKADAIAQKVMDEIQAIVAVGS